MIAALVVLSLLGLFLAVGALCSCMLSSRISRNEEESELRQFFGDPR
jgi:Tfp pilus assembly protein PilX